MKNITITFVVASLFTIRLLADFSEPFTDSPAGKTITSGGRLIINPGEKSGFSVVVFTDAGHRFLPAEVSTNLNVQSVLGTNTAITATIREDRSLMIVDFPKSVALTNHLSPLSATVSIETSASSLLEIIKKRPDRIKIAYLTSKVSLVELKDGITLYAKSTDHQREMCDEGMKVMVDMIWGR